MSLLYMQFTNEVPLNSGATKLFDPSPLEGQIVLPSFPLLRPYNPDLDSNVVMQTPEGMQVGINVTRFPKKTADGGCPLEFRIWYTSEGNRNYKNPTCGDSNNIYTISNSTNIEFKFEKLGYVFILILV